MRHYTKGLFSSIALLFLFSTNLAFSNDNSHLEQLELSAIKGDILTLEKKLPTILQFRKDAVDTYHEVSKNLNIHKRIRIKDSQKLYKLAIKRKNIRNYLNGLKNKYQHLLDQFKHFGYHQTIRRINYEKMTLITSLIFLMDDNYLSESIFFQMKGKLRRFLNKANTTYDLKKREGLKESSRLFFSLATMSDRIKAIKSYKKIKSLLTKKRYNSKHFNLLSSIIESSFYYHELKDKTKIQLVTGHFSSIIKTYFPQNFGLSDLVLKIKDKLLFSISYASGQTILQAQWRDGKLLYDKTAHQDIKNTLKPGDVLWDKTRSKLSGVIISISGFWNHNAIYIGSESQLKELGIWNHPRVRPFQSRIRSGKHIIESLAMGVVLNTVEHFMNIDDLAIGRRKNITKQKRIEVVLESLSHFGKAYDYNLDAVTAESIICSELIYIAYSGVNFELTRMAGHWTFTPDLAAKQTLAGGDFKIVGMYYLGQKILSNFEHHMSNILNYKKTVL